jgi:hypothetical protein
MQQFIRFSHWIVALVAMTALMVSATAATAARTAQKFSMPDAARVMPMKAVA